MAAFVLEGGSGVRCTLYAAYRRCSVLRRFCGARYSVPVPGMYLLRRSQKMPAHRQGGGASRKARTEGGREEGFIYLSMGLVVSALLMLASVGVPQALVRAGRPGGSTG